MRVAGSGFWAPVKALGFCWPRLWALRLAETLPAFVRLGSVGLLGLGEKGNEGTGHAAFWEFPAGNHRNMVIEVTSKCGY